MPARQGCNRQFAGVLAAPRFVEPSPKLVVPSANRIQTTAQTLSGQARTWSGPSRIRSKQAQGEPSRLARVVLGRLSAAIQSYGSSGLQRGPAPGDVFREDRAGGRNTSGPHSGGGGGAPRSPGGSGPAQGSDLDEETGWYWRCVMRRSRVNRSEYTRPTCSWPPNSAPCAMGSIFARRLANPEENLRALLRTWGLVVPNNRPIAGPLTQLTAAMAHNITTLEVASGFRPTGQHGPSRARVCPARSADRRWCPAIRA